jgi:hypothetical protein
MARTRNQKKERRGEREEGRRGGGEKDRRGGGEEERRRGGERGRSVHAFEQAPMEKVVLVTG